MNELEERIVDLKGEIVDISKEVKTQDITLKHIGGEIVDISTKVKTKLAKLEERVSRMESFHRQQEEFYGVNRERKMLDDFLSITETRIKSLKGKDLYKAYPEGGFHNE